MGAGDGECVGVGGWQEEPGDELGAFVDAGDGVRAVGGAGQGDGDGVTDGESGGGRGVGVDEQVSGGERGEGARGGGEFEHGCGCVGVVRGDSDVVLAVEFGQVHGEGHDGVDGGQCADLFDGVGVDGGGSAADGFAGDDEFGVDSGADGVEGAGADGFEDDADAGDEGDADHERGGGDGGAARVALAVASAEVAGGGESDEAAEDGDDGPG